VPFPTKLLNQNEELVLDLRPHWIYVLMPTISLIGSVVFGILVWNADIGSFIELPTGVLILGVLCWFGLRYLKWVCINFVVTSQRVIFREGVVAKRGIEIPLERINTVFFNQTVFERLIGAGDLGIESAGERGNETFEDVRKPHAVQNEIYRQMEKNKERMYPGAAAAPQAAASHLTIPEQIEKLDDLRRRGVITDQEFAAKKAQLLERM
jgi:uncharacterized membrane protein YdbT with pleckstrin-like domain